MANAFKISLLKGILCAESSDLLKRAKEDSRTKSLIQVHPYQIRTEINLVSAKLVMIKEAAAVGAARNEAAHIEDELVKKIKELVQKLEKCQAADKLGDDKAGDQAQKAVKDCTDDLDDSLPDFGTRIRKAVEKGIGVKLASSCKSVSSGQFRGIKLVGKFEHGGASAEVVKDYQDAAKSLDTARRMVVDEGKEDKKASDGLKQTVLTSLNDVSSLVAKNDSPQLDKLVAEIPRTAQSFGKAVEGYSKQTKEFASLLAKTGEALAKEAKEFEKDLSTPEFKTRKDKFNKVRSELEELKTSVDRRINDQKQLAQQFREAERIKLATDWKTRLTTINAQVTKLNPIDTDKFAKAVQDMVSEGKKKI